MLLGPPSGCWLQQDKARDRQVTPRCPPFPPSSLPPGLKQPRVQVPTSWSSPQPTPRHRPGGNQVRSCLAFRGESGSWKATCAKAVGGSLSPASWAWPATTHKSGGVVVLHSLGAPTRPGKEPGDAVKARQWLGSSNLLRQAGGPVAELCLHAQRARNRGRSGHASRSLAPVSLGSDLPARC